MRLNVFYMLFAAAVAVFAACQKDNSDQTTIVEDKVTPDVTPINCASLSVEIASQLASGTSTLTATANGGSAPYTYKWSTNDQIRVTSVKADGTYYVTATDANGCSAVKQIVVVMPTDPCEGFSGVIELKNAATGLFLSATTTGGTPPYTYDWSNGAYTQSIAYNPNVSTNYSVTIVDANGCAKLDVFEVAPNPCSSFSVRVLSSPPSAVTPGKIEAFTAGGTPPYTYKWSTGATTKIITNVTPGNTYTVRVSESQGCYVDRVIKF